MGKSFKENSDSNRIENLSVSRAVIAFLLIKQIRITGLKFIVTIISNFFIPQFQSKFKLKHRQIVNVDHKLDKLIPFSAEYLGIYMGFIQLWIKSLYFVYREFGKQSVPLISQYFSNIGQLYRSGFAVYNSCQSTTTRPGSGRNIPLKLMHWADPHLHCVPSLHIMIIYFNHLRIGTYIQELAGKTDDYETELLYLWEQALQITRSVLFMKQHSINCIPAGLLALSTECSEFTDEYALNLIDEIKKTNTDSIDRMEEISEYISDLYIEFRRSLDSETSGKILIDFLLQYDNKSAAENR